MADNQENNGAADQSAAQDDQEWESALDSYSKDRGVEPAAPAKKEDGSDANKPNLDKPADPANKPTPDAGKPIDQTPKLDADGKPIIDKAIVEPVQPEAVDNPTVRETRQTQREIARQESEMKDDIRKELFSDKATQLLDSDGDPIKSIEDVQKLRNPQTGKAFTEEEAASWLLKSQQHLNEQTANDDKEVERIATVNLDLMDQADVVKARFGALLKTMPDIAKKIVTKYNASLKTDPKTGYILEAPMDMQDYFELALEPYQTQAQQLEALKQMTDKEAEDAKRVKESDRKQNRSDRSDIYGGGKVETMDDEEAEWASAAKKYYKDK